MQDGLPYVEIVISEVGATWTAVLVPKEKQMKLFQNGIYVGLYVVE
jgi:hypothetical protein